MAARAGVPARVAIQVRTGESTTAAIAEAGIGCEVTLRSVAPEAHALVVTCEGERFVFDEPSHGFETRGVWSVDASCWYAQAGHREGCDTCRAVDYCEGPDVSGVSAD